MASFVWCFFSLILQYLNFVFIKREISFFHLCACHLFTLLFYLFPSGLEKISCILQNLLLKTQEQASKYVQ